MHRRLFASWRLLTALALLSSCDSRHAFDYWSDQDPFIEGDEFSVTVSEKKGVHVTFSGGHGEGTTIQDQRHFWRVFWERSELKEGVENSPSRVLYLGQFEEKRDRSGSSKPVFRAGFDLDVASYTGHGNILEWEDYRYISPAIPMVAPYRKLGEITNDGKTATILTSSRQHVLLWENYIRIAETTSLKIVSEMKNTEVLAHLRRMYAPDGGSHRFFLSDDLRYVAITSDDHNRAWATCYDQHDQRSFERRFELGKKRCSMERVESVEGRLNFLVHSDDPPFAIFDADGQKLHEVPYNPEVLVDLGDSPFWIPERHEIWKSNSRVDLDMQERKVLLKIHNYKTGKHATYMLNSGKLKAP